MNFIFLLLSIDFYILYRVICSSTSEASKKLAKQYGLQIDYTQLHASWNLINWKMIN